MAMNTVSKKKRNYGKKKYYNKYKKKYKKPYTFKIMRWSNLDGTNQCHFQIAGNDTIPSVQGTTTFALSNTNGYGELQSLFDNYRITKILYRWVAVRDNDTVTTTANQGLYPRICWVHDFNDSTSISRAQMYQHSGMREVYMTSEYQRTKWYTLKPSVQQRLYESSTSDSFTAKWLQWIDTSEPSCPHYGIKYHIDQNYTGNIIRFESKVFLECKGIS